jgi:ketosteroid isomerase-like protein
MKTLFKLFLLPLLLFLYLSPIVAQEWSPEQKEVVEFLNEYTKSSMPGDMDEIMSYFHVDFSGREYSMTLTEPLDRESIQKAMEDSYQNFKVLVFEVQPLTIQIHGDVAIAHSNFQETLRDANGVDNKLSGPWTATLLKQDKEWVFLSWTWLYLEN